METTLELLRMIGPGFLDAYYVVNRELEIIDFNRLFFSLFPRSLARKIKGMNIEHLVRLELGRTLLDVPREVFNRGSQVRYDEVEGFITDGPTCAMNVSGIPLYTQGEEEPWGALVLLRDVTDEAVVQAKYKRMLEDEARRYSELEEQLRARTRELLELGDELERVRGELVEYRKKMLT